MAIVSMNGRYVCHTCETILTASIIPILADLGKGEPTIRRVEAFVSFIRDYCDPYWQGNQGITTKKLIDGFIEYMIWSSIRHKCHHKAILRHYEDSPPGYKPDPIISAEETKLYRLEFVKRYAREL